MEVVLEHERAVLMIGDSATLELPESSVDALVTDPPAAVNFMGKEWDSDRGGREHWVAWLAGVLGPSIRALKPGAYALVWALPRTSHWAACALEDAGLEVRDIHHHIFGTGFPKSLDLCRQVDMYMCEEPGRHFDKNLPPKSRLREHDHLCREHPLREKVAGIRRTALKPAVEHWILARKPIEGNHVENGLEHGTGGLNVEACRIGTDDTRARSSATFLGGMNDDEFVPNPNIVAGSASGRWPAHLSVDDFVATLLEEQSKKASKFFYCAKSSTSERDEGLDHLEARSGGEATGRQDGTAGVANPRAGAGRGGGRKNIHPTAKSIDLMRWLVRLVTPPGGVVLDPFAGSGSTGVAALAEGMSFIGVELGGDNGEYIPVLTGRVRHALGIEK